MMIIDQTPCKNCGQMIYWDNYYEEWTHTTGDPQCSDEDGNLLPMSGAPKED